MSTSPTKIVSTLSGSSFGAGTLAYTEHDLFLQLAPFGMTKKGFTALRKALGVPGLVMPNGSVLIDSLALQLAWRCISSLGSKDFIAPGAPMLSRGSYTRDRAKYTRKIDLARYRKHWKIFISELLLAKRIDLQATTQELATAVNEAAERLALSMAQLTASNIEAHRKAMVNSVRRRGIAPALEVTPRRAEAESIDG